MLSRSLNATTNVPRDGSMSGCMVGSILTQIQEVQAAYKNLGKSYCAFASANAGSGKRMPEERERDLEEDDDDVQDLNMENMSSQDGYRDGQELGIIECGHVYHVDCVKEWFKIKNSCPICKRDALAILT
ncbi:hypothetical protein FXO38_00430 [Capsicum annuum]|nr:hypothetical protein FXO38_00430 [Capsicum annuum]KAF3685561.1 hypothetical protein FXO37_00492 [Capsicum annuum]